jgi:hypothetical protein
MDFAIHQQAIPSRVVAITTQLYEATGRAGSLEQATWRFLDRFPALSKGNTVSRAAAFSLGAVLASAFGASPQALVVLKGDIFIFGSRIGLR